MDKVLLGLALFCLYVFGYFAGRSDEVKGRNNELDGNKPRILPGHNGRDGLIYPASPDPITTAWLRHEILRVFGIPSNLVFGPNLVNRGDLI